DLVLESRPVIAAVLAAQSLDPAKALPMLRGIQHAHYERGQHVVREETLRAIAAEIGLDAAAFDAARKSVPVDEHIAASQELMNNVGAQGFPTFVLQIGNDWFAVPHGRFASAPAKFAEWLDSQLRANSRTH
ncbi:MAG TPA: DsbA family protein, partial [Gammaproteobacteria bacterium]|nr:DsbA family protein [Gammaproteobacteria bacterium]